MGDGGVTPHTGLKSDCRQNAAPEGSSGGGDAFRVGINPRFSRLAFTATFWIAIPLCFSPKPGVDVPGGTGGCGRAPTLWMGHEGCPPRCSPRVFLLLRQRRARLLARRTGILQQELPRVGTELAPPVSHIDTPPPPPRMLSCEAGEPSVPPHKGHHPHKDQVWRRERSCWDHLGLQRVQRGGRRGREELRPPREQRGAERSVQRLLFPAAFIPCLCVPSQPGTWLSLLFRAGVLAAAFCYFSLGALIIFSII